MPIDWCVKDKLRPEIEGRFVDRLEDRMDEVTDKIRDIWEPYVSQFTEPLSYSELVEEFNNLPDIELLLEEVDLIQKKIKECYISVGETLGAPRVGIDAEATEWLREKWEDISLVLDSESNITSQYRNFWGRDFEDILDDETGKYILELVESEGIGTVTGVGVNSASFRGGVVTSHCRGIVGKALAKRASTDHEDPEDLIDLGEELYAAAEEFAEEYGLEWVRDLREQDNDTIVKETKNEDVWRLLLCYDAAKWCKFWGGKGHGMYVP